MTAKPRWKKKMVKGKFQRNFFFFRGFTRKGCKKAKLANVVPIFPFEQEKRQIYKINEDKIEDREVSCFPSGALGGVQFIGYLCEAILTLL